MVCGGGTSAYLGNSGKLFVWGKLSTLLNKVPKDATMVEGIEGVAMVEGVEGVAIGHDHLLLLRTSGWVDYVGEGGGNIGGSDNRADGSRSCSVGSGSSSANDNAPTQSNNQQSTTVSSTTMTMPPFVRYYSSITNSRDSTSFSPTPRLPSIQTSPCRPVEQILKISAGVRHSAAITTDGWSYFLLTHLIIPYLTMNTRTSNIRYQRGI